MTTENDTQYTSFYWCSIAFIALKGLIYEIKMKISESYFGSFRWLDNTDDYGNDRQPTISYSSLTETIALSSFLR